MATRPWTPADAASVLYCDVLDTSTLTFPTSSTVSAIASKVGTIVLNQGGPAGYAAKNGAFALFGASSYRYLKTSTGLSAINATGPLTMWFVGNGGSGKSYTASMSLNGSGNDQHQIGTVNTGQIGSPSGGADLASNVTYGTNGNIVVLTWDGSSPVNEALYGDGTLLASQTRAPFTTQASTLQVLTNSNETTGAIDSVQGFGIITGVLSTADRQRLEGWCAWRYNLVANLPAAHPYKSAAPTVVTGGGATVVNPTGLPSTNAFGTDKVRRNVKPMGRASTVAFGTDKARARAKPGGLPSTTAFGAARIAGATALTPGTYGAGTYGSGDYSYTAARPAGIASTLAFGATKIRLKAKATGRASTVLFGATRARLRGKLTGLASTARYGAQRITLRPRATGRPSTLAFGTDKVRRLLHPAGKPSAVLFGATRGRVRARSALGLASTIRFGQGVIRNRSGLDPYPVPSIPSTARYGLAKTRLKLHPVGVSSGAAFGYIVGVTWTATVAPGDGWQAVPGAIGNWTDLSSTPGNWS